jgi:DNA repair protein RadC
MVAKTQTIESSHKYYVREKAVSCSEISSAQAVYEEMKEIAEADQESFHVLYVNSKNCIIGKDLLFLGGITSARIDLKILFRRIFLNNCSSFIVCHNHPSGSIKPSREDKMVTESILKASEIIDVRFLDHVIIGDEDYYSFSSNGLI